MGEDLGGEENSPAFGLREPTRVVDPARSAHERVALSQLPPPVPLTEQAAISLEVGERQEVVGVRARQAARGCELPSKPQSAHERRPGGGLEGEDGRPVPALVSLARSSQRPFPSRIYLTDRPGPRDRTTAPE